MKTAPTDIVYELSIEDPQLVARESVERDLTSEEVATVGNTVGDYIENAIHRCVHRTDVSS